MIKRFTIKSPTSFRLVYAMAAYEAKCYARMLDNFAHPIDAYVAI